MHAVAAHRSRIISMARSICWSSCQVMQAGGSATSSCCSMRSVETAIWPSCVIAVDSMAIGSLDWSVSRVSRDWPACLPPRRGVFASAVFATPDETEIANFPGATRIF